jgi:hypothetical protein
LAFQSRLTQLESDVADLKTELGELVKGDGGASGKDYRMRLESRRYEYWLRIVDLLGYAMVTIALARAFNWI